MNVLNIHLYNRTARCLPALVALLCLCPACQEKVEQPALSDDKIARIMADLNIAEAATIGLNGFLKDSLTNVYYKQVMEMHGVTKESYEKDLRILVRDVERMEAIENHALRLLEPEEKKEK